MKQTYAEIVTPGLGKTHIRDFTPDATVLAVNLTAAGAAPMCIGEWYELDPLDGTGQTIIRGVVSPGDQPAYMCMAEVNRTDVQSANLIPVIWDEGCMIKTQVFDTAAITSANAVGLQLAVDDVVHSDGNTYRSLVAYAAGAGDYVVAVGTGLDAAGYLHARIVSPHTPTP
jgi:hypothetical protein